VKVLILDFGGGGGMYVAMTASENGNPNLRETEAWVGGVVQAVECLPSKREVEFKPQYQ
jgi:pyruvate/2-oxoglutarate dehydrogenase complex dihydrolipoamide dehydrogenase (E3) component